MENSIVRAAAVTALAKFGVGQKDPEVKSSISVLLTRCLDDTDDEVRDRAALNLRLMKEEDEVANRFIRTGEVDVFIFTYSLVRFTDCSRFYVLSSYI